MKEEQSIILAFKNLIWKTIKIRCKKAYNYCGKRKGRNLIPSVMEGTVVF